MMSNAMVLMLRQMGAAVMGLSALAIVMLGSLANAANIGFVVDPGAQIDSLFDVFWFERLETQGHAVTGIGADEPADSFPDIDIFIISNDVGSGEVVNGFGVDDPRPMISYEWGLNDEWGLSDDGSGDRPNDVAIDIEDPTHPLAAGFSGEVEIYDFEQGISRIIGEPAPGLDVIATYDFGDGLGPVPVIAVLEAGSEAGPTALFDPTPGQRIFIFSHDGGDGELYTDDGLKLLDTSVDFALGIGLDRPPQLQAGDADQDFDFDQLDLVQVQIAAKYLSGQAATWGEGDWDGAPGGEQGSPPAGNGLFDQLDIISALSGGKYLTGPYAAINPGGVVGDGQATIIYNATSGELSVDAPAGTELTSINIDSAAGIFTGDAAQNLGGSFDNDADNNIFKATFGSSFGSLSFGNVAQAGLSEQFVLDDLTVVGSLAGGGDLGNVDLIYVPEPTTVVLLGAGLLLFTLAFHGRKIR